VSDGAFKLYSLTHFYKTYLLYATECMRLSSTHMRSLRHTWQSAVSRVFNITGEPINLICSVIDDSPLDLFIIYRRIK